MAYYGRSIQEGVDSFLELAEESQREYVLREAAEFWQWYASDLTNSVLRGVIAAFLVATTLDLATEAGTEWDAYDLKTADGTKIEVKSDACILSWQHPDYSTIQFGIAPPQAWNPKSNTYSLERKRQTDIYVFCLLAEKDQDRIDPLNTDQWLFCLMGMARLDRDLGAQKTFGIWSVDGTWPGGGSIPGG